MIRARSLFAMTVVAAGIGVAAWAAPNLVTDSPDVPGPAPARTDAAAEPVERLDDQAEAAVRELALSLAELPAGSEVIRVVPGFDADGHLTGGVAEVRFPPYSGNMTLASNQGYRAGDEVLILRDIYEYDVADLRKVLVAVDLSTNHVQWASPEFANNSQYIDSRLVATTDQDGIPVDVERLGLSPVRAESGQ